MTATYHMRAHEQLFALAQVLSGYDDLSAVLRDNRVEVVCGERRETITCTPRSDDGGKLWFWDSHHRPIGQADQVADVALMIAGRMRSTP